MGKVYRARHLTLRKELAVKVLAAGPADFEARFEREARAIARLDHPNCVRVLDYGKSADHHYIAMDLVAGDTLATTLRAGPLDTFFSVVLPLARPGFVTAAILGFAHTVGEFGVVLMIGGNIPGQTRVVSVQIFDHVEAMEYAQAHWLAGGMVVFSFFVLLALYSTRRSHSAWN